MIKEFKEFISRGNVMDMAVGVIMGQLLPQSLIRSLTILLTRLSGSLWGKLTFPTSLGRLAVPRSNLVFLLMP